jgi:hypothetical protein
LIAVRSFDSEIAARFAEGLFVDPNSLEHAVEAARDEAASKAA